MKYIAAVLLNISVFAGLHAQVIIRSVSNALPDETFTIERGFLPGKAFKFYPTLNSFDFNGKKMRVELFDDRDSLRIRYLPCTATELTNVTEFAGANATRKVAVYIDTLFKQANIAIDSSVTDILIIHLQALDNRLIGFVSITAHGLCQMSIEYKSLSKTYCEDITDKSPHSPIDRNALVTRRTGSRIIQSAAIREVIEQMLTDLKATE